MFKDNKELKDIISKSVKESFRDAGINLGKRDIMTESSSVVSKAKTIVETIKEGLNESFILTPKSFLLKTEFLSSKAKEAHEKLYNGYVKAFDKLITQLQTANTEESESNHSAFRSLKIDEQYNLNAVKLHELYFNNISDLQSAIAVDSVPYMRFSRDFGTFEKWQYDFRACCMAAREGWAITYFEPLRKVYINCIVDGHNTGIPIGGIPVLVIDMWAHSYYRDYLEDKKSYVNAMMKEINWNVLEARMVVAERSRVSDVFEIRPFVNDVPQKMLSSIEHNEAPIGRDQIESNGLGNIPSVEGSTGTAGTGNWQTPNPPVGGAKGSF